MVSKAAALTMSLIICVLLTIVIRGITHGLMRSGFTSGPWHGLGTVAHEPFLVSHAQFSDALDSVSSRAYFHNLGTSDLLARDCDSSCSYRDRVLNSLSFLSSGDPQVKMLFEHAKQSDSICAGHLVPALAALPAVPWKFALLNNAVEGGMPHTHSDVVCLPLSLLSESRDVVVRTLVHEKLHVLQRVRPNICHDYLDGAGWVRVGRKNDMHLDVLNKVRSNPDLDEFIYKRGESCPTVSLLNGGTLTDTQVVCIHGSGERDEYEHPYEMMAYTLSHLVVPATHRAR